MRRNWHDITFNDAGGTTEEYDDADGKFEVGTFYEDADGKRLQLLQQQQQQPQKESFEGCGSRKGRSDESGGAASRIGRSEACSDQMEQLATARMQLLAMQGPLAAAITTLRAQLSTAEG